MLWRNYGPVECADAELVNWWERHKIYLVIAWVCGAEISISAPKVRDAEHPKVAVVKAMQPAAMSLSVPDDPVLREEYKVDDPGRVGVASRELAAESERPSLAALLAAAEKAAEARRAATRERQRASRRRLAEKQLEAIRAYDRERKRAQREALTPEQLDAQRTRERERRQGLTDEEFEAIRVARRERERRRLERDKAKVQKTENRSKGTEKRSSQTSKIDEIGDDCDARRQVRRNARNGSRETEERRPPRRSGASSPTPTNDEIDDEWNASRHMRRTVAYVCVNDVRESEDIGAAPNAQPTCINCMLRDGTLRKRSRRCYSKCIGKDDILPEHAHQSSQTEHHITLVWCPRPNISTCSAEVQVDLL
ncbi:zinc finger CCCH domain-containing protein 13 isoform X1 [Rhipicephalus sanguineus]|uniref:zinc finger CCCH domain-containing protein 13 isoform X1 n=1 Tax=Rhipicephalus sanguineus TaxID=34632 RepID=UPI00189576AE|nr:zinc finger CCCH domain-containing protein 13 isoform X1 [Rhipicephalus sanguineus]